MGKRFLSITAALTLVLSIPVVVSCSGDDEGEDDSGTSLSSTVTVNDEEYTAGSNAVYFNDSSTNSWGFTATLKGSSSYNLVIYYEDADTNVPTVGEVLDGSALHIALLSSGSSVSASAMLSNTTLLSLGDVTAVEYSKGIGLEFDELIFSSSTNSGNAYTIDGTIYYTAQ